MTELTTKAKEESTYTIQAVITDEDDNALTPNSLTWTLLDLYGNVINEREDVELTPASTVSITMSGDDLAVTAANGTKRRLLLEGDYDSDYGEGLPLKEQVEFEIEELVGIS